jgi:PBP1b-binding outer membrane lipoprotein LpoB
MKKSLLTILVLGVFVTGCASTKSVAEQEAANKLAANEVYKLQNYKGPEAMDSNELAVHSRECVVSKMRPRVTYVSVRAEAGKILVPISVVCEPYIN